MRSAEEKGYYSNGQKQQISNTTAKGNGSNQSAHNRTALGKPTPSKWDDAQKWLVGFSRGGERIQSQTTPRNSNADDRRLIAPVPDKVLDYSSGEDVEDSCASATQTPCRVETKKMDEGESFWRINKSKEDPGSVVRSICVRDMGTEMTPIASKEPSRSATPIRATTPISSGTSTPSRTQARAVEPPEIARSRPSKEDLEEKPERARKPDPVETRAMAWDEAERAKYMARYKREEVKIEAWENHEKRKAEIEMRKMEVKAERLKARSEERLANKLAATKRIAEEKRSNAEAELNEKAVTTSQKADYIRRTGNFPSSFSFKLPSLCW